MIACDTIHVNRGASTRKDMQYNNNCKHMLHFCLTTVLVVVIVIVVASVAVVVFVAGSS
jgi:t-SNARE complex subunit (syntaxin)